MYFSIFGDEKDTESAKDGLEAAGRRIRHLVAKRMQLRKTPDFTFHFDDSIMKSSRMDQRLKEINDEL